MKIDIAVHTWQVTTLSPVVLENRWVRLEPLGFHHLDALWDAGQASRVWDFLPVRVGTRDDMERFVQDSLARERAGTALPFAIFERAARRVVGSTALFDYSPPLRAGEIGWTWHSPEVWGTSVNLAAKTLLLGHCFDELDMVRVYLKTDINNIRSQKAIEKLGAKREGVWRKHMKRPDGSWRDSVFYSILDDEWPPIKAGLEEKLK